MILRCFLLLIFLFQAGFSPLIASDKCVNFKKTAKSESKQKSSKSELCEEDEDESEKHFGLLNLTFIQKTEYRFIAFVKVQTSVSDQSLYSFSRLPIFIWVQNFRI